MKILIVINDYMNKSNGMCISTQRFVKEFREAGHEVRIATNNRYGEPDYSMDVLRIPILAGIIEKEGFTFAKINRERIREAVSWADLVHVEDPFMLCAYAADEAKRQGKPLTGTFHMYPENMTYAVHMGKYRRVNNGFMKGFLHTVYEKCDCIQCPTDEVKERLEGYEKTGGYGNLPKLWVISNGISEDFLGLDRQPRKDPSILRILSVGRFAVEKNQKLLLEAVALSRYKEQIRLMFAGKGPLEEQLKSTAEELGIQAYFHFLDQETLREVMLASDLYIHCADIEVEGMSCMEAFACGSVPIISEAELSSTKVYALSPINRFAADDARELAFRIDYFFEHPEMVEELSRKYMDYAQTLSVKDSAKKVLWMMDEAVRMANR